MPDATPKTSHAWPCSSPMHCASLAGWVIGCEPREPEVCPKILQRAVVCASCVHKRKFCVSWRAANGLESSHRRRPQTFWNGHGSRLIPRLTRVESPPHHHCAKTAVPLGKVAKHCQSRQARHHAATNQLSAPVVKILRHQRDLLAAQGSAKSADTVTVLATCGDRRRVDMS